MAQTGMHGDHASPCMPVWAMQLLFVPCYSNSTVIFRLHAVAMVTVHAYAMVTMHAYACREHATIHLIPKVYPYH